MSRDRRGRRNHLRRRRKWLRALSRLLQFRLQRWDLRVILVRLVILVGLLALTTCAGGQGAAASASTSASATGSIGAGATNGGQTTSGSGSGGSTTCITATNEFAACQTDCDCGAPLTCTSDTALNVKLCEWPCQSLADCPSAYSACDGQTCGPVPCGPFLDSGFETNCVFLDGGGTCLPMGSQSDFGFDTQSVGLCSQAGPIGIGEQCVPGVTRLSGGLLFCIQGELCGSLGQCAPICNPQAQGSCIGMGDLNLCVGFALRDPTLGVCQANQDGFGDGGSICLAAGSECDVYTECCSLACGSIVDGLGGSIGYCCNPVGGFCQGNYYCCNGNCGPGNVCACIPSADPCVENADCCSGVCDGAACK